MSHAVVKEIDATELRALRGAFRSARSRAASSNREFTLNFADVLGKFEAQGRRCAISGLAFTAARIPDAFVKHPFAPSLDRIDCRRGYAADNVRVVCIAVNFGLGQWGEEVFRTIAEATVRKQPQPSALLPALLEERIEAAEAVLPFLSEVEQGHQTRRIAALKRARTLGPEGLKKAADRALKSRRAATRATEAGL